MCTRGRHWFSFKGCFGFCAPEGASAGADQREARLCRAHAPAETAEEPALGCLYLFRRLGIALGLRLLIQLRDRQLCLEMAGHVRQLPEDLPWRRVPSVHSLLLPFSVHYQFRHAAGPMKVQVWV